MRRSAVRAPALWVSVALLAPAIQAAAQVPPDDAAPPAALATPLPLPDVDADAAPTAFLDAARRALAAGRIGEAQEALERAESRALVRSVRPSRARLPSQQPLVNRIAQARAALAAGDRMQALQCIDEAIAVEFAEEE